MGSDFQIFTFSPDFADSISLAYIYVGTRFKVEKRSHARELFLRSNGIRKYYTVLPQSQLITRAFLAGRGKLEWRRLIARVLETCS